MTAAAPVLSDGGPGELVQRIRSGDDSAWPELVDSCMGTLAAGLRSMRLNDADLHDVMQTTWLRLVQNIERLADPDRVGAWLMTTARREALRVIAQRRWIDSARDLSSEEWPDETTNDVTDALVAVNRNDVVRRLLAQLPEKGQQLMLQLFDDSEPTYEDIARSLDMPIGSIGPTRMRCLRKLADLAAAQGIDLHDLRS